MKVQAILAAGGIGERLNLNLPKALVPLKGKPLFVYSLQALEQSPLIDGIIVVAPPRYKGEFSAIIQDSFFKKVSNLVDGGPTRVESVQNALKAIEADTDIVLIHDAARPFITEKIIQDTVRAAQGAPAVIAAVPTASTIKRINPQDLTVDETLNRRLLWEVQTPQVFQKDVICRAHQEITDTDATDDAYLVERLNVLVKVVMGDYQNIKITTPQDLRMAEKFLED